MKELSEKQKKLAEQMIDDIEKEVEAGVKAEETETEIVVPEKKPNALVDGILEWGGVMDLDNVPERSVLLIRVNVDDHQYAHHFQMGVVKYVLEPRFEKLKEKKVTVLFMGSQDDISILTEADMAKSGWKKVDKSVIINPFDK
jgi:hypothetical protein